MIPKDGGIAKAHDAVLVDRFKAGDQEAFDEIVSRYRERVYQLALRVIRNPQDAEEVTQDTFIRAFRGLANFRGDSALVTWLYQIANNLARTDPTREGYGFGLTMSVRRGTGGPGIMGSPGDFSWGGAAGTNFWVDPKEQLVVVFMAHTPGPMRLHYRKVVNALVLQSIVD